MTYHGKQTLSGALEDVTAFARASASNKGATCGSSSLSSPQQVSNFKRNSRRNCGPLISKTSHFGPCHTLRSCRTHWTTDWCADAQRRDAFRRIVAKQSEVHRVLVYCSPIRVILYETRMLLFECYFHVLSYFEKPTRPFFLIKSKNIYIFF